VYYTRAKVKIQTGGLAMNRSSNMSIDVPNLYLMKNYMKQKESLIQEYILPTEKAPNGNKEI